MQGWKATTGMELGEKEGKDEEHVKESYFERT